VSAVAYEPSLGTKNYAFPRQAAVGVMELRETLNRWRFGTEPDEDEQPS
jgi:hypothetical protein